MFASIVTGLVLAVLPLVTATSGNFPAHLSYDVAKSLFSKRILLSDNPVSFVPKGVWVGTDGLYTINFINHSSHDLGLVVWAPHVFSSFVTLITPSLTVSITSGSNLTISFDYGSAGAWSAVYPDTPSYSDQIPNTWGEFTFGSSSTQGPIGAGTETGVGIVETETATLNALSVLSEALGTWTVSRVPSDNTRGSGTFAESSQVSNSAVTTAPDGSALGVTGKYPGTNTQSSSARQSLNSDSALQSQSAASGSTNGLSASAGSILISYHSTTSGGYADASSQAGTTATTRSTSSDGSDPYSSAGPPANRSTKTGIEVSVSGTSRGIESSEYSVPTPITASQTSLPIITTEAVGSTATPTSTVTAKTTSHSGAEKMASVRWLPAIITVLFCFIV
ncbi:hypothetical protein MBLNU459_g4360t1 [Dothideomycetes sp. NU459]